MAHTQVLLLKPINGLGAEGDTVTVRAGYARNFLLPRKLALPVTQANKKQVESLLRAREVREQKEFEEARALGEKWSGHRWRSRLKPAKAARCLGP